MEWPLAIVIASAILGVSFIVIVLIFVTFIKKLDQ